MSTLGKEVKYNKLNTDIHRSHFDNSDKDNVRRNVRQKGRNWFVRVYDTLVKGAAFTVIAGGIGFTADQNLNEGKVLDWLQDSAAKVIDIVEDFKEKAEEGTATEKDFRNAARAVENERKLLEELGAHRFAKEMDRIDKDLMHIHEGSGEIKFKNPNKHYRVMLDQMEVAMKKDTSWVGAVAIFDQLFEQMHNKIGNDYACMSHFLISAERLDQYHHDKDRSEMVKQFARGHFNNYIKDYKNHKDFRGDVGANPGIYNFHHMPVYAHTLDHKANDAEHDAMRKHAMDAYHAAFNNTSPEQNQIFYLGMRQKGKVRTYFYGAFNLDMAAVTHGLKELSYNHAD